MLGVLKVAELVEGDFCCAMECIDKETAVCFLFTKVNNFQFNIGVAQVFFENKDNDLIESSKVAGVMQSAAPGRMRGTAQESVPIGADVASTNLANTVMEQSVNASEVKKEVKVQVQEESENEEMK